MKYIYKFQMSAILNKFFLFVLQHISQNNQTSINHNTSLSDWYVCQSTGMGGMPTPPSTDHSPVSHLGHLGHLMHHGAAAAY